VIAAQDKVKRFQAFGIRQSDDKMYVAYHEEGYPDSFDLVVTLWSPDLQFIDRVEYSWEIPPPLPGYPSEPWNASSAHPHFTDGIVDVDGSLVVAGSYFFWRREWEFIVTYMYSVAVKHSISAGGDSLTLDYEYFPNDYPLTNPVYPPSTHPKVAITRGPMVGGPNVHLMMMMDESYLISTGTGYTHYWSYRRLDGAGQLVEVCPFTVPFGINWPDDDPPGSGCFHVWEIYAKDFTYVNGRIIRSGRTIKRMYPYSSSPGCPQELAKAFTTSYTRWLRIVIVPSSLFHLLRGCRHLDPHSRHARVLERYHVH
jgi:hypothetical protein